MKKTKILVTFSTMPAFGMITMPLASCNKGGTQDTTKYQVTITHGGHGNVSPNSIQVNKGSTWGSVKKQVTATADPSYHFKEWQKDGSPLPNSFVINSNFTAKAIFEKDVEQQFKIEFKAQEGTGSLSGETTVYVNKNTTWANVPKPTPVGTTEYSFVGWYNVDTLMTNDMVITSDMNIIAKFDNCTSPDWFDFSFDSQTNTASIVGCSSKWSESVTKPDNVVLPSRIISDGKTYTVVSINDSTSGGTFAAAANYLKNITLSNTITKVGNNAFASCSTLANVVLNQGLEAIGEKAFFDCTALTTITIPKTVTTIGNNAFASCSTLANVVLNQGLETIGEKAFFDCTALTTITIPKTVTTIGNNAFASCSTLANVVLNQGLETIGEKAFFDCTALTTITIPKTVTTIGKNAFGSGAKPSWETIVFEDKSFIWNRTDGSTTETWDAFFKTPAEVKTDLTSTYAGYSFTKTVNKVQIYITVYKDGYIGGIETSKWDICKDYECNISIKDSNRELDLNNCSIKVNDEDIKLKEGIILTNSKIRIPYKYLTKHVAITLTTKITEFELTKDLDAGFISSNFPAVYKGQEYVATYQMDDAKTIDFANYEIKVGTQTITSYCEITRSKLTIPSKYVTGNLSIKLKSKTRQTYTISTSSSSVGVKFSSIPPSCAEGDAISGTYTYDDTTMMLGETACDILVGNQSIKSQTGVVYKNGRITIPAHLFTDNVTIKIIITIKPGELNNTLQEIVNACNKYEASSRAESDKTTFLNSFKIGDHTVTSSESLIGSTIKITINSKEHVVRIIDFEHDTIAITDNKAALTFELVTVLSDSNGSEMTSIWDADNNCDYTNSVLRANLTGEGTGEKAFTTTALQMLPSELQSGIKTVKKHVSTTSTYQPTEYSDKLFPLTYTEMALSGSEYAKVEGEAYKYWTDHNTDNDRIKKDAAGSSSSYWLVSPYTRDPDNNVWVVGGGGGFVNIDKVYITNGVSFAFCI